MSKFPTLESLNVANKTVLVRTDLNVPMHGGRVTDNTRILRLLPTLNYLLKKKVRVVLLSHFDRPGGKFVPSLSLAPLVDPLSAALGGRPVQFGVDCVGPAAHEAVKKLAPGGVLLLENLRFHAEEEKGGAPFARELASLGDAYVNDAFSASHRAHASITGIPQYLPSAAGRLMEEEVAVLESITTGAKRPIAAIVGGAKISSKLALLGNLTKTMDVLIIGGAMANSFLYARGYPMGASLFEKGLKQTALRILKNAEKNGCRLLLPVDVVTAESFTAQSPCRVVEASKIPARGIALDIGPATLRLFSDALADCKTVVWNGPIGAFETSPFDAGSVTLARSIASLTARKKIRSIAGGGDTVASLSHAGLTDSFSYISTAGGAFLEWLEGKKLPGVAALIKTGKPARAKAAR